MDLLRTERFGGLGYPSPPDPDPVLPRELNSYSSRNVVSLREFARALNLAPATQHSVDLASLRTLRESEESDFRAAQSDPSRQLEWLSRYPYYRDGLSFGGRRDMYVTLGYDRVLEPVHYRARYMRGGIAKRLVEIYPRATWSGGADLVEDPDPEVTTPFEAAVQELWDEHRMWAKIQRADILAGLGRYSVLLIGAPGDLESELTHVNGPQDLLYLTPYPEDFAKIIQVCSDQNDPRYGMPEYYLVSMGTPTSYQVTDERGNFGAIQSRRVHWTRIIHIAEGLLMDEVYGVPRLRSSWNYLHCLEKIVGGGAEGIWKRADPGLQIDIDPTIQLTEDEVKKFDKEVDHYTHDGKKVIRTRGAKITPLAAPVADFTNQADFVTKLLAADQAVPHRVFMGSERGEMASTQDRDNWSDRVAERRAEHGVPVVRSVIDRFIDIGLLPEPPDGYDVVWPDEEELNEQEKAQLASSYATANQAQRVSGGGPIMTNNEIRDTFLGLEALDGEPVDASTVEGPTTTPDQTLDPNAPHNPNALDNPGAPVGGDEPGVPDNALAGEQVGNPVPVQPQATKSQPQPRTTTKSTPVKTKPKPNTRGQGLNPKSTTQRGNSSGNSQRPQPSLNRDYPNLSGRRKSRSSNLRTLSAEQSSLRSLRLKKAKAKVAALRGLSFRHSEIRVNEFNPDQARDHDGKWTGGGADGGASTSPDGLSGNVITAGIEDRIESHKVVSDSSPMAVELNGIASQGLRAEIKREVCTDLESRMRNSEVPDHTTAENLVPEYVNLWAETSGDHSARAIAMQRAVAEEFNISDSVTSHMSANPDRADAYGSDVNKIYDNEGVYMRAFARAQYNATQEYLSKAGISTLTLERGAAYKFADSPAVGNGEIGLQPASSFAANHRAATWFAGRGDNLQGFIHTVKVPASRVLSTARTGIGCLNEWEVILLGGRIKAHTEKYP